MKINKIILSITILSTGLTSCGYHRNDSSMQNKETTTSASSTYSEESETDLTITLKSEYYYDEKTNTLVYFAKDQDSETLLYNLVLVKDNQEKKTFLSLPSIPESFIIDGDWIYYIIDSNSVNPEEDSKYHKKLRKLKRISKYFGDFESSSNFFRENLETKEIQWLGANNPYVLDDKYIYFLEIPIDLDQYGMGKPNGDWIMNNSLCRMDKDGSNPVLVSSEKYQIIKVTNKYIYTVDSKIDKITFKETKIAYEHNKVWDEVYYLGKRFYTTWDFDNKIAIVYCYDLNTDTTVKIAQYSERTEQIIPLKNGGLIIYQSDSRNRETYQVAKIYLFDRSLN